MPSASPIPISMFTTKTESWNSCATIAVKPRPTRIETSASTSGTPADTSVPKTSTSTISAAGSP